MLLAAAATAAAAAAAAALPTSVDVALADVEGPLPALLERRDQSLEARTSGEDTMMTDSGGGLGPLPSEERRSPSTSAFVFKKRARKLAAEVVGMAIVRPKYRTLMVATTADEEEADASPNALLPSSALKATGAGVGASVATSASNLESMARGDSMHVSMSISAANARARRRSKMACRAVLAQEGMSTLYRVP